MKHVIMSKKRSIKITKNSVHNSNGDIMSTHVNDLQTSQNAELYDPLMKYQTIDSGGRGAVLNYSIPEPTSYSGRNFINLKFSPTYFKDIAPPPSILAKSNTNFNNEEIKMDEIRHAMENGFRDERFFINNTDALIHLSKKAELDTGSEIISNEPVSVKFSMLTPSVVSSAIKSNKKVGIYRTIDGSLSWVILDKVSDDQIYNLRQDISSIATGPVFGITIKSPSTNSTVELPQGANLEVKGTLLGRDAGMVGTVMVKLGTGPSKPSTRVEENQWIFSDKVPAGTYSITAHASIGGEKREATIHNVNVRFKQPEVDTVPPSIDITSPVEGTEVVGTIQDGAKIIVKGTATDNIMVRDVEVKIGEVPYQKAQADPGGWHTWSASFNVTTPGLKIINAKVTDTSNLVKETIRNISVRLLPTDSAKPTVKINFPPHGNTLQGLGSTGFVLEVGGIAKDEGSEMTGIADVKVKVSGYEERSARPLQGDDWSQGWICKEVIRTEGLHRITARAIDKSGKVSDEYTVEITVIFAETKLRGPHLILVESYRLSSYLGNYGAGRTIKTLSLLPGEKTRIRVKTFTSKENKAIQASSILDSVTSESSESFSQDLGKEQTDKEGFNLSQNFEINAKAHATWGWGGAEIGTDYKESTNSAREEFAKNISNTTKKHVSQASAKRDLKIETSYEVREQNTEEISFEQEIENINLSRTLNFVFRQMNQEFLTFLHLTDIRLLYVNVNSEDPKTWISREVTLPEMDSLLDQFIIQEVREIVRRAIIDEITSIKDYEGKLPLPNSFIKKETLPRTTGGLGKEYYRVNKGFRMEYPPQDPSTSSPSEGLKLKVPGIIISVDNYVLRTEGIIAEALLGQGEGLDTYSKALQFETVEERRLNNSLKTAEVNKINKALELVSKTPNTKEASDIFAKAFPCCQVLKNKMDEIVDKNE